MNTEYATKEGYAIFTGNSKRAAEISTWCKERNLVHNVDYKYHCRRWPVERKDGNEYYNEIIFQFRDPKQATVALLKWT